LYNPCMALWRCCSVGLTNTNFPSSCSTLMSTSIFSANSPLGPFMVTTLLGSTFTSTPLGNTIGAFPIRDMVYFCFNKFHKELHHRYFCYELPCRSLHRER